ncbi:hypothetical protein P7K49_027570 [Saguinus oedipus]|uniref:Uncharacterized protein n=1 Tax=Saguinus oedipus TaxID=9490 RepID=A0ABQ9UC17_SAGOE|nr:hypothetical protein P7K49_027570 [Saguinus oedipus]
MWAWSDGTWLHFLSTRAEGLLPVAGLYPSLDPGSFTDLIQATGPVPPRHVDRGEPRKGLRSNPAHEPAAFCLFASREAGLEFQQPGLTSGSQILSLQWAAVQARSREGVTPSTWTPQEEEEGPAGGAQQTPLERAMWA